MEQTPTIKLSIPQKQSQEFYHFCWRNNHIFHILKQQNQQMFDNII